MPEAILYKNTNNNQKLCWKWMSLKTNQCSYMLCFKKISEFPCMRRFKFPVKQRERCTQWIINSGITHYVGNIIDCSSGDFGMLKNCFICADHFDRKDILVKTLVPTAVPIQFNQVKEVYSQEEAEDSLSEEIENFATGSTTLRILTSPKQQVSASSTSPSTLISIKRRRAFNFQKHKRNKKNNTLTQPTFPVSRQWNPLKPFAKAFVTMQLCHKAKKLWNIHEKKMAISLFHKSPNAYKFLRSRGVILPSPTMIKKMAGRF